MSIQNLELPDASVRVIKKARRAPGDDLDITIETITPAIAETYLGTQKNNRNLSRRAVKQYARDMKEGRWHMTGEAIRFDEQGRLIDGQHRLKACVESGVPLMTVVVRNLDRDSNKFVDIGRSRSSADTLHMGGIPQAAPVAAAARVIIGLCEEHRGASRYIYGERLSPVRVVQFVERHPDIIESCRAVNKPIGITKSVATAFHYVIWKNLADREMADAFGAVITEGKPFYEGDAVHAFRETCLRALSARNARRRQDHIVAGLIQATNHWLAMTPITRFKQADNVKLKGFKPEVFDA